MKQVYRDRISAAKKRNQDRLNLSQQFIIRKLEDAEIALGENRKWLS